MIDLVLNHRSPSRVLFAATLSALAGCASSSRSPSDPPPRSPAELPPASTRAADGTTRPIPPRIVPPAGTEIGRSREGRPIVLREFTHASIGRPDTTVLLFAGIHGDEVGGVYAAAELIKLLDRDASLLPPATRLLIVPLVNPDGYAAHNRKNASGVDLNRNFPAKNFSATPGQRKYQPGPTPLSEPESRVIHDLVLREKPARILSLHSIKPPKHGVNYDGPARKLAELIASKNHYNVLDTMGYPTPGSFGSWAGIDLQIPTITLEFPSNAAGPTAWAANREALLAFIRGQ